MNIIICKYKKKYSYKLWAGFHSLNWKKNKNMMSSIFSIHLIMNPTLLLYYDILLIYIIHFVIQFVKSFIWNLIFLEDGF